MLDVIDVEGSDDRGGVVDLDGRADAGLALVSAREVDGDGALSDEVVFFPLFSKKRVLEQGLTTARQYRLVNLEDELRIGVVKRCAATVDRAAFYQPLCRVIMIHGKAIRVH